ncbi:hypothetical protein KCU78_g483, partial [Aureobasidium melanogenum]
MSHATAAEEAFAQAKKNIAKKLELAFELKDDPDKKFLPSGKAKEIIFDFSDDLTNLCNIITDDKSEDGRESTSMIRVLRINAEKNDRSCLMLAVLLCMDEFTLPQWIKNRDHIKRPSPELPLDKDSSYKIFGPDLGQSFYDKQFAFCPVILRKKDLVNYKGTSSGCRLPYLEEKEVGKGLFGTVYMVKIPEKHVQGTDSYYVHQTLARKDFESADNFEREWKTMQQILQARHKNPNIMLTFASLQLETTLDYLKRYDARRKIFMQVKGLANALKTLHKFDTRDDTKLSCFHMDLKPENILVCVEENDSEVWKITDFGISRVETIGSRPFGARTEFNLGELAVGQSLQASTTCRVTGPGGGGTYLAPEATASQAKVTNVCDVWSLACVILAVMAFAYGGPDEVKSLEDGLRVDGAGSDWFFITEKSSKRSLKISDSTFRLQKEKGVEILYKQNPRVGAYLKGLSFVSTDVFKDLYGKLTKFLLDKALVPNPKRRIDASELSNTLQKLFGRHLTESPKLQSSLHRCNVRTPFNVQGARITHTMLSAVTDSGLAEFIAFVSPSKVYVHETSYPHRPLLPDPLQSPYKKSWSCCALGQDFLCIAVESNSFELVELGLEPKSIRAGYGPIKKCAVSADCTLLAFVTQIGPEFRIHAFAKDELYRTEGTYTNKLHGGCIVNECKRVVRLQFSPDGRYLHAVLVLRSTRTYGAKVIIWDVGTGKLITTKRIPDRQGNSDHFDFVASSQHVSIDSPTQQEPSVVLLTEGRYLDVVKILHPEEETCQDLGGAHRVLDFMVDESSQLVFFVARVGGTNFAKVFCAPFLPGSGERWAWKDITPLDASVPSDYNASTDSFYLRPWGFQNIDGESMDSNVMIATLGGLLLTFVPIGVEPS